jgi:hypothetical protein
MKTPFVFIALLTYSTLLSAQPTPDWLLELLSTKPEIRVIPQGHTQIKIFVHEETRRDSPREGLKLVWITIPAKMAKMVVEPKPQIGIVNAEFERATRKNDLVITSGGFCSPCTNICSPEGLVISERHETHPKADYKSGGYLTFSEAEGVKVVPLDQFSTLQGASDAIQNKPILVAEGQVDRISPTKADLSNRLAVGVRRNGDVVIVGAFRKSWTAMTLYEFAQLLTIQAENNGPGLDSALNLEGAWTHIYVPPLHLHFGEPTSVCIPNKLHFGSK